MSPLDWVIAQLVYHRCCECWTDMPALPLEDWQDAFAPLSYEQASYTYGPALTLLALRDSQRTWASRQPHHFTSLRVGQNEWTCFHGDVEIVEHLEVQSDRHLVITGDLRIGRTLDIGVDACVYVGGALTAEAVRCTGRVIASTLEARALIVLRALRSAALVARSVTTRRLVHGDAERYANRWDIGAEDPGDGDELFDSIAQ